MRIIEYGHIKPKVVKCNYCGAILEMEWIDIRGEKLGSNRKQN